jgi:hypothetical protein
LLATLFGAANIKPIKFSNFLNENAKDGWKVRTMEKDKQRAFLIFKRESYVVIMERKLS